MINKLTIKQYKCFENFEIKGLKRVNLITGKNGIGKTAFLEYVSEVNCRYVGCSDRELDEISFNRTSFNNDILKEIQNHIVMFDKNIVSVKLDNCGDFVFCSKQIESTLLSKFGHGLGRFLLIIHSIIASKDFSVVIDEIDNGIHYTKFKEVWKSIFDLSKKYNCQIFATTHNIECIEAFNEVRDGNSTFIEFYKNMKKQGKLTYSERNKDQLAYALTHKARIRGE